MPMPPPRAMAMAILASVTVSMGEDTSGAFRVIFYKNRAAHRPLQSVLWIRIEIESVVRTFVDPDPDR